MDTLMLGMFGIYILSRFPYQDHGKVWVKYVYLCFILNHLLEYTLNVLQRNKKQPLSKGHYFSWLILNYLSKNNYPPFHLK